MPWLGVGHRRMADPISQFGVFSSSWAQIIFGVKPAPILGCGDFLC